MQINILIVDDVEANLISLEALLETIDENYNIIKANSGTKALETTLNEKIDLIILDIQMPDMDGFEVAQLLKSNKTTKDIPIIFLTAAFKSEEWKQKGFKLGAIDYLSKPINENQFINRIILYTKLIKTIYENRHKDMILSEQSKMASMGEMIGNIAHQWRQPLSVISTAASGIQLHQEYHTLSDEILDDMLVSIIDSAQYLSKTIDDFRDLVKGDAHKIEFNIFKYLNKVFTIEKPILKNNSIQLITNIDETLKVNNFANLFIQVIINIINNAKDALKNIDDTNRYLFIDASRNSNSMVIKIKDNGGGIDENVLPNIFDAYFTTKHQSQGTGLGLYMTYNMCQSMNVTIEVENCIVHYNEQEFKGAEFTITIPS